MAVPRSPADALSQLLQIEGSGSTTTRSLPVASVVDDITLNEILDVTRRMRCALRDLRLSNLINILLARTHNTHVDIIFFCIYPLRGEFFQLVAILQ